MGMDENNIAATVRVGKVTDTDLGKKKARVKFLDEDMTSGWLPVIQRPQEVVGVAINEGHSHGASVSYWMPKVNDMVLCLYRPMFNADGFILGAITS